MTRYSKFNIIYRLQKWLDSVPGQTFMNYAYSWGASIVILGTLFKLTHLPGANFMLFLGMGTEVVVFFIAAFDRPFDKTADGMELPTHVEAVPGVVGIPGASETMEIPESSEISESPEYAGQAGPTVVGGGGGGGTIIIGGGGVIGGGGAAATPQHSGQTGEGITLPQTGEGMTLPQTGEGTYMPQAGEAPVVDTEAIAAVSSSVTTMAGGTVVSPVP